MKKSIKLLIISELMIIATNIISFEFFINVEVAFLSSFFIIVGSMLAYKKLVNTQIAIKNINEKRDALDEIEDPHELYDDALVVEVPVEELDLKTIVQEEKKKIKILNFGDIKKGSSAGFSPFRVVPYIFLILGFISLKNHELLNIMIYLPSLLFGIVIGHISSKSMM